MGRGCRVFINQDEKDGLDGGCERMQECRRYGRGKMEEKRQRQEADRGKLGWAKRLRAKRRERKREGNRANGDEADWRIERLGMAPAESTLQAPLISVTRCEPIKATVAGGCKQGGTVGTLTQVSATTVPGRLEEWYGCVSATCCCNKLGNKDAIKLVSLSFSFLVMFVSLVNPHIAHDQTSVQLPK